MHSQSVGLKIGHGISNKITLKGSVSLFIDSQSKIRGHEPHDICLLETAKKEWHCPRNMP